MSHPAFCSHRRRCRMSTSLPDDEAERMGKKLPSFPPTMRTANFSNRSIPFVHMDSVYYMNWFFSSRRVLSFFHSILSNMDYINSIIVSPFFVSCVAFLLCWEVIDNNTTIRRLTRFTVSKKCIYCDVYSSAPTNLPPIFFLLFCFVWCYFSHSLCVPSPHNSDNSSSAFMSSMVFISVK